MNIPTTVAPRFAGNTSDMDRDLVVLIKTEEPNIPHVFVEKSVSGSEVALLSFVPEFQLKEYQVEAIFLVDCSGSMEGISMDLAKESLQVFIHSLPLNSFFNIIIFGTTYESMFPGSKKSEDDSLQEAKEYVHTISADLGGDNNDIEAEKQVENPQIGFGNPKHNFVKPVNVNK